MSERGRLRKALVVRLLALHADGAQRREFEYLLQRAHFSGERCWVEQAFDLLLPPQFWCDFAEQSRVVPEISSDEPPHRDPPT